MGKVPLPGLNGYIIQSEKHLKNYNLIDDGFTFLPKIFKEKEITSAKDGLWETINGIYETGRKPETRFWEVGDDSNKIIKIDKPHLCNEKVWALITNKRLGKALAEETCSKRVQVWHSQVVWKPKSIKSSGNAGWHRDSQYWPFWGNDGLFTAWIALSNVSVSSGPVRFIPGSNHWEKIRGLDFFDKNLRSQEKILEEKYGDIKVVSALLRAGQIGIHSSHTYHSSCANLDEVPRVGMVVHFCTEHAKKRSVKGIHSSYLDQLSNFNVAPRIYDEKA